MAIIICRFCGREAERQANAKYCSVAHKQAAWRARRDATKRNARKLRIEAGNIINQLTESAIADDVDALQSLDQIKQHLLIAEQRYLNRDKKMTFKKVIIPGEGIVELTPDEYEDWKRNHKSVHEARDMVLERAESRLRSE